ncbi:hypothetical protein NQ315_004407 [Exocentrus adspersus]|uniref:Prostaglandin reductase 1 n=1 Tax=Exocentrus adspersus TaxID=1586481 RepID=A0AAV8W8U8_9CUCU|nr:hypothetical protein NQ315_004407 [Exocentrus adspersus]
MVKAKVFVYQRRFDGWPKEGDLKLVEEELPPVKNGEFLAEAVYLSVDPYSRVFSSRLPLGAPFLGYQIAKVLESKNPKFPIGRHVFGYFGWRTHTVVKDEPSGMFPPPVLVPEWKDVPLSYFLGVLGMTGNTAYFGVLEICQPKKGDVVLVSAAAGGVGSVAGQIFKIKGCTVIGLVGTEEKGKWLVNELGFDNFINYKTADLDKALSEVAPKGIDCYFDTVGGHITNTVLSHMNEFGRIGICGTISSANEDNETSAPFNLSHIVGKQIKMEGFTVLRWPNRQSEGMVQNHKWIQEGRLKTRETVTEGFENAFKAFLDLFLGNNIGKAVVEI